MSVNVHKQGHLCILQLKYVFFRVVACGHYCKKHISNFFLHKQKESDYSKILKNNVLIDEYFLSCFLLKLLMNSGKATIVALDVPLMPTTMT